MTLVALFFTLLSILFTSVVVLIPSQVPVYASDENVVSTYVVHTDTDARPSHFVNQDEWYSSMIESLIDDENDLISHPQILYKYETVLEGFAARLTSSEAERFAKIPGVLGVREEFRKMKLDTTRSPEFLGLNVAHGLWPESRFGEDVIIGLVDSGIWPESQSFNDRGLGPVPSRWKGTCQEGAFFNSSNCNRKLVGARSFTAGAEQYFSNQSSQQVHLYRSPRDGDGHGTHTASTAAGAEVQHANIFGFADGIARGVAPRARVAMYKACSPVVCAESDILAAIDSAVKDGVDVLSISIGGGDSPYYENPIAIGAFAAMRKNIFVSCSAGNGGPGAFSVHNTAPWITTVGAGSMDRSFPVQIHLGNNRSFVGSSLYSGNFSDKFQPLQFLGICTALRSVPRDVTGKIGVCNGTRSEAFRLSSLIRQAGGAGLIQLNYAAEGESLRAFRHMMPAATLGHIEALELLSYINSTKNPVASFRRPGLELTVVGKDRAPILLSFSARGPNTIVPEILKPDLIAPGFQILAAWPSNVPPTRSPDDPRSVDFNVDSGTSMSTPHAAGAAALLRAAHPNWSPAAIKSALMTTARIVDNQYRPIVQYEDMKPATPISIGAGHVDLQLAADPGLVYDADISDYIKFLCSLNYTANQMRIFTGRSDNCAGMSGSPGDLNYPSFSVVFKPTHPVQEFTRTLTHVGTQLPEVYTLKVVNPSAEKVTVSVKPETLVFHASSKMQNYTIKFQSKKGVHSRISMEEAVAQMAFGSISWESDLHVVRSPFAIMWN